MENGQSYLGLSQKNNELFVIQLDKNGRINANSSLGNYDGYPLPSMQATKNGYLILFFNNTNSLMETVNLNTDGKVTNQKTLMNASNPIIMTHEGEFFSVELRSDTGGKSINPFEGEKTIVIAKKLDNNGILMWEQPVTTLCKPKAMNNIEITSVVQTSDGGYIILGSRDNFFKC